ncbi:Acyltransferase, C-terminal domain,Phospholipid/glycerol acyltransferase [Cinara cedri]|uniref:Acyltransferase, C-terminal domain,Phospholipid/glycerol acyltransferase n=1 Tax=Cinara cedri TaxID=506608 RepID=A0A5E4M1H4_9HEMI|nr:Acyltransferase, C-terminal domain,Phospholipid/glycerol acyltransferase [Cinara cedri]
MEWRGIAYITLWYLSITCGFLGICCPTIPLMFIYPRAFRYFMGTIFSVWEMYPTVLMRLLFNTRFIITGDRINPLDGALLIMNHRNRLDWNFLWAGMYYSAEPPAHKLKMILKSAIRHVPFAGWVMQLCGFLYIQRRWDHDQTSMKKQLKYFSDLNDTHQILLFPEGTDLSPNNIARSNKYADKNNLPNYKYVLHPKTTGFVFLADTMRTNKQLNAVYDLTVGYPDLIPQTEMDALKGVFPKNVHFHIKRYDESELPINGEDLKIWLNNVWQEKEKRLAYFTNVSSFSLDSPTVDNNYQPINNALYLAIFFWTLVQILVIYFIITSSLFQYWCLLCCIVFFGFSFTDDGFQMFEVNLYNRKINFTNKNK